MILKKKENNIPGVSEKNREVINDNIENKVVEQQIIRERKEAISKRKFSYFKDKTDTGKNNKLDDFIDIHLEHPIETTNYEYLKVKLCDFITIQKIDLTTYDYKDVIFDIFFWLFTKQVSTNSEMS